MMHHGQEAAAAGHRTRTIFLWDISALTNFPPSMKPEEISDLKKQCLQDGRAVFNGEVLKAVPVELSGASSHGSDVVFVPLANFLKPIFGFSGAISGLVEHVPLLTKPQDVAAAQAFALILGEHCPDFFKEVVLQSESGDLENFRLEKLIQFCNSKLSTDVPVEYVVVGHNTDQAPKKGCRFVDPEQLLSLVEKLHKLASREPTAFEPTSLQRKASVSSSASFRRGGSVDVSSSMFKRKGRAESVSAQTHNPSRGSLRNRAPSLSAHGANFLLSEEARVDDGRFLTSIMPNEQSAEYDEIISVLYELMFGAPSSVALVLPWLSYVLNLADSQEIGSVLPDVMIFLSSQTMLPYLFKLLDSDRLFKTSGCLDLLRSYLDRFVREFQGQSANDQQYRHFTEEIIIVMKGDELRTSSFSDCLDTRVFNAFKKALLIPASAPENTATKLMLAFVTAIVNDRLHKSNVSTVLLGLLNYLFQHVFSTDRLAERITHYVDLLGAKLIKTILKLPEPMPDYSSEALFDFPSFLRIGNNEPFVETRNTETATDLVAYVYQRLSLHSRRNEALKPLIVVNQDGSVELQAVIVFTPKSPATVLPLQSFNIEGDEVNDWNVTLLGIDPKGNIVTNSFEQSNRPICVLSKAQDNIKIKWYTQSSVFYFTENRLSMPTVERYLPAAKSQQGENLLFAKIHDDLLALLTQHSPETLIHQSALKLLVCIRETKKFDVSLVIERQLQGMQTVRQARVRSPGNESQPLLGDTDSLFSETQQTAGSFYRLVRGGDLTHLLDPNMYGIGGAWRNRLHFALSSSAVAATLVLYFLTKYQSFTLYDETIWGSRRIVKQIRLASTIVLPFLAWFGAVMALEGLALPLYARLQRAHQLAEVRSNQALISMVIDASKRGPTLLAQLKGLSALLKDLDHTAELGLRAFVDTCSWLNEIAQRNGIPIPPEVRFALSPQISHHPVNAALDFASRYQQHQQNLQEEQDSLRQLQLWFLFALFGLLGVVLFFVLDFANKLKDIGDAKDVGLFLVECVENFNMLAGAVLATEVAVAVYTSAREGVGFFERRRQAAAAVKQPLIEVVVEEIIEQSDDGLERRNGLN